MGTYACARQPQTQYGGQTLITNTFQPNRMKAKYFLFLAALGLYLGVVGASFKIQHWPGADSLLLSSCAFGFVGVIGFVVELLALPKAQNFLNR